MSSLGVVAVHCGAGYHTKRNHKNYNFLSRKAIKAGVDCLVAGGCALEAVKCSLILLENDPLTNAGYGSNLTRNGFVETDASIMDGTNLKYGACGAVRKVKNPIELAYDLCVKQTQTQPLGLIPPSLLVDKGALEYAKDIGLNVVTNKSLISKKALKQFLKNKRLLAQTHTSKELKLDTVGAVCVDKNGCIAAGCSSGGIMLKRPGRIGQGAMYACGAWADSYAPKEENSIAICTTGCGEYLVQTQLAKELGTDLKCASNPPVALYNSMTDKFINSRFLDNVTQKYAGALALHVNSANGDISVLWGHSTETMSVGYMSTRDFGGKAVISTMPTDSVIGQSVNIGGSYFYNV